jgi:hypothetical protein
MMESKLRKHTHFTKSNHTEKHHHRPEILQAVDYLETKRFIKKLNTNPGPGLIHGRGRPKTYFAITEKGLKTLLADTIVPAVSFWKIVYYYCLNNESLVTPDKIEQYYRILIGRYLKYPNRGFSSPLDIFHNVYNKWIKEAIVKSNKITTVQKIIEVLAINPRISDKKLDDLIDNASLDDEYIEKDDITEFFTHDITNQNIDDDGKITYELSLFGVMISLVLIYYNNIGRLKGGLYFKEFSVQQYYDKIASNYKMKLPLIFGKWNQLKRVLKVLAIHNFNIILNKDEITSSGGANSQSVMLEGNKELCDSIRTISLYNAKLMVNFAIAGRRFLLKTSENISNFSEFEKTYPIRAKLKELVMLLIHVTYTFPDDSDIYKKAEELLPPKDILRFQYTHDICKKIEESFAEEITAFYYMNMNSDISIRKSNLANYFLSSEECSKLLDHTPREYLSLIFQEDRDKPSLREWFSKWMQDLASLQEEILQNTKKRLII